MKKMVPALGFFVGFFFAFSAFGQSKMGWVFSKNGERKTDTIWAGDRIETHWRKKRQKVEARLFEIRNDSIFFAVADSSPVIGERLERLQTLISVAEKPPFLARQNNGLRWLIFIFGALTAVFFLPSLAKNGDGPNGARGCLAILLVFAGLSMGIGFYFRMAQPKIKEPSKNWTIKKVEIP